MTRTFKYSQIDIDSVRKPRKAAAEKLTWESITSTGPGKPGCSSPAREAWCSGVARGTRSAGEAWKRGKETGPSDTRGLSGAPPKEIVYQMKTRSFFNEFNVKARSSTILVSHLQIQLPHHRRGSQGCQVPLGSRGFPAAQQRPSVQDLRGNLKVSEKQTCKVSDVIM